MLNLTREQRIRVDRCRVELARNMVAGTISHCRKLFNAGMVSEAVEILADFSHISENEAYKKLLLEN